MKSEEKFFKKYWLLIVAIVYLLLSIDIIPDRIPLIGTLDDVVLFLSHLIYEYVQSKKVNEEDEVSSTEVKEGEIIK